ncbi:MAG: iron-sulfur cluster assembly scaffold protein [Pseudomonadota bacterium]
MLDDAYSARMLELSGRRLPESPLGEAGPGLMGRASRHARLCGSELTAEVRLVEGRIAAHAQTVEACALGRASAAIVAENAVGADIDELRAARDSAARTLETGTFDPASLPEGRWGDLALLTTLQDFRARHGSVMLAFEAVLEAAVAAQASLTEAKG